MSHYSTLCSQSLLVSVPHRRQMSLSDTFRFSIPQNASIGPLSIQRDTLDILWVIPALSNFFLNTFEVYWYPRSLWKIGFASGCCLWAMSKVSNTSALLLEWPSTADTIFHFCYVGKPFLSELFSCKFPVQHIFGSHLRSGFYIIFPFPAAYGFQT